MTTDKIKKLYLAHADDFRKLLGVLPEGPGLAIIDEQLHHVLLWGVGGFSNRWALSAGAPSYTVIPSSLAVAAMTQAWLEMLEKDYATPIYRDHLGGCWYWQMDGLMPMTMTYDSLPEAICGAVEVRAAEKQAEEAKAAESPAQSSPNAFIGRLPAADDLKARMDHLESIVRRIDQQLHSKTRFGMMLGVVDQPRAVLKARVDWLEAAVDILVGHASAGLPQNMMLDIPEKPKNDNETRKDPNV